MEKKTGMVDISDKKPTQRSAVAEGSIMMGEEAFTSLINGGSPKGDVFETAKVAGIMAAKNTPEIIPMCHPLDLSKVNISFDTDKSKKEVTVVAEVKSIGRTGVEMEALTAVCAATLTIYDMMKWADKAMVISEVKLLKKSGGKSGDYQRSTG